MTIITLASFLMALLAFGQTSVPSLNVSIRTDHHDDFEAGTPRVLACIVFGCAPSSPIVTWYLGDTMLRPNVYKEVNRGNFTVSSLTFVPSLIDNGKELVCKVTNDFMTETFEDRVTVSVGHRPTCVNSGFQTVAAVEGESATLVCKVTSDPEPEQFIWTFADGRTIYTTSKKVSGHDTQYSTTLVWVARADDFGPLYCRASNRFGEQKQPCTFSVIKSGQPTTSKCNMFREDQESLKVLCEKSWEDDTTQQNDTAYNYEHPEDMPPIFVLRTVVNLTIVIPLIFGASIFCAFCIFIIKRKFPTNRPRADVLPDVVIAPMDLLAPEYIEMREVGNQRSATYNNHEHICLHGRNAFLEQQMFHV